MSPPSATAAAAAATSDGGSPAGSIPKWVYALAIGVPVAAALAYILFGPSGDSEARAKKAKKAKAKAAEAATASPPAAAAKPVAAVKPSAAEKKTPAVEVEDCPEEEGPTDPLERALAAKNKGNKYFRGGRYELAIKCYTEAIELCPRDQPIDLATFHQNRAAAYDQMENLDLVIADCDQAVNLNNKYTKALDRRAKSLRKQAMKIEDLEVQIEKLKQCLDDLTAVCILEGFQKQEHLTMVDAVLRELGRAEAGLASKNREPLLTSAQFVSQYFSSFAEDPVMKEIQKDEEGDVDEKEYSNEKSSGFAQAKKFMRDQQYEHVVAECTAEIEAGGEHTDSARLLRATFLILQKQPGLAQADLNQLIESPTTSAKVKVNALVKRASLFIQQCKDPTRDPELSLADFARAAELDPDNPDIYHHRGQVHLLTDSINSAIVDFNKSVSLNPNFPVAYAQKLFTDYRAASMIGDAVKITEVIEEFKTAVDRFPKCVEVYALCAQIFSYEQEFDKAEEMYKKALTVDPQNANLYVHRGMLAMQSRGDVEAAVQLMEEALQLDEKCEFAYETLGTIEVQRGNLKRAVELFDKAIPLANTELEMAHMFGLRDAATAQITVSTRLGIERPTLGLMD